MTRARVKFPFGRIIYYDLDKPAELEAMKEAIVEELFDRGWAEAYYDEETREGAIADAADRSRDL